MKRRTLVALGVAFPLVALSGCHDSTSTLPPFSLYAPSKTEPPAPGPIPANARDLAFGQSLSGVIRGTDPPCPELEDPQDELAGTACQPFKVMPASPGYVTIAVTSPAAGEVPCVVFALTSSRWIRSCATFARRSVQMQVLGGVPYAFGVEFETPLGDRLAPGDSAAFTVTASFSENAAFATGAAPR